MHRQVFIFFIVFFLWNYFYANGQNRNNVWMFGNHTGLDFNTTPPQVLKKTIVGFTSLPYYTTSICDSSGKLLFYTDGSTVWNQRNKEIPKYLHRWPWGGHVMPLICPYPGNDSLYYLFGVSDGSYENRLQYLTINMKGNGWLGEIVYPQPSTLSNYFTVLLNNASVLVAGTAHCNNKDTWIVAHSGNALYSFLVTANGVDSVPVVSKIDPLVIREGFINAALGNIKFSANGEKMVVPVANEKKIVVFNFNNTTGQFSNPVALSLPEKFELEDVELSPDGTKLYYGAYEVLEEEPYPELHDIFQMDLKAGSEKDITKTNIRITTHPDREVCSPYMCIYVYRTLQLTPDGRIYISMRTAQPGKANFDLRLSVIENPNEAGLACFYRANAIDMGSVYQVISYNYIRSQVFSPLEEGIQVQTNNCADKPVSFSLLYNQVDSVKWDFGDLPSGDNNFSRLLKPQHTYPAPGTYIAKAIIYKTCNVFTAVKKVTITTDLSVHVPPVLKDTVACTGDTLHLDASTMNATGYMWNTGLIYPIMNIYSPGTYSVTVYNACSLDRREFSVKYDDCYCKIFVPNVFTPNRDGLNDVFKPVLYCSAKDLQFSVYNSYGKRIFTTTKPGQGWNGYDGSTPADAGTYVWVLQYRNPNNRQVYNERGPVMLIR